MSEVDKVTTARRPNLFDEARGELAQDAVLAWILKWGAEDFSAGYPALHAAARRLLDRIGLVSTGERLEELEATCQTGRGKERPDVIVRVTVAGQRRAAIIEHKVHAKPGGRQLERYFEATKALTGLPFESVKHVFVKTGLLTRAERARVGDDWLVLGLDEIIEVLEPSVADTSSDIYRDYVARLKSIQADIELWRSEVPPLKKPAHLAWEGLFEELSHHLSRRLGGRVGHGLVNPPGGGTFASMWWGWRRLEGHLLYLQAHPKEGAKGPRVAVKCQTWYAEPLRREKDRALVSTSALREHRDRIVRHPAFTKASPLRSGKHSAVAYAMGPWWRVTPSGGVDIGATVDRLMELTRSLDDVAPR